MAYYGISEPLENKMQFNFSACLSEKFYSAYSFNALNEPNLVLSLEIFVQHEKKLNILSFSPRKDAE
jgi:hypothetical protein